MTRNTSAPHRGQELAARGMGRSSVGRGDYVAQGQISIRSKAIPDTSTSSPSRPGSHQPSTRHRSPDGGSNGTHAPE